MSNLTDKRGDEELSEIEVNLDFRRRKNGIKSPQFRKLKVLAGIDRRDYNYDVFWVAFPLVDENKKPLFANNLSENGYFLFKIKYHYF